MKYVIPVLVLLLLASCGGKLSDEQREKIKEDMKQHKIMKVSDAEILSGAMDLGKTIFEKLDSKNFNAAKADSLEKVYHAKITFVKPGATTGAEIENQLIEAYVLGMATGSLQENIQKLRTESNPQEYDSLLFSKPVVTKLPDGADNLEGVWNIYLSKKDVILSLGK